MTKLSYVIPTSPISSDVTQKKSQQFYTTSPPRNNMDTHLQHGYYTSPIHNGYRSIHSSPAHSHSLSDGYVDVLSNYQKLDLGSNKLGGSHEEEYDSLREYSHFQMSSTTSFTPTKQTPNKLVIGSPKQDPIGSPLQSPKGIQSSLNTPSTRRALNFHDEPSYDGQSAVTTTPVSHNLYSHFHGQETPQAASQPTGVNVPNPNNPSPWTKSGLPNNGVPDDELSPTNPQPFNVYFGFPSVINEDGQQVQHQQESAPTHGRSTSFFSNTPPLLKQRQSSVTFAPDVLPQQYQQQQQEMYNQYPVSQSYPRPQYGVHMQQQQQHHHQQQGYPSSYPMYQQTFHDQQQQQYQSTWFEGVAQYQQNQQPHMMAPQQQQQPYHQQPHQQFSPTRNVSFKSPKSKSYPSSPNRSPSQPKRNHVPRAYSNGGNNGYQQNGFVTSSNNGYHQPQYNAVNNAQVVNNHHHLPQQQPTHMMAPQQQSNQQQQQQPQQQTNNNNGNNFEPPGEGNRCRGMYKEFAKEVKEMEKSGYKATRDYVLTNLHTVPYTVHWRVYMDLADLAKRENMISEARKWFKKVNELQPGASQGWLEHAKLEEECGRLEHCERLLMLGLDHCPQNESLLVKAIKHFEQVQNILQARGLLSRLRTMSLEKSWKIMLEGALLESRLGNVDVARKVFKYLMQHVSRHGPIYYEAYRLEEKCEEWEQALLIVERGLEANPRYGPLWFAAFHLYEKRSYLSSINSSSLSTNMINSSSSSSSKIINLDQVRECLERAVQNISKELIWKVHFEQAQIEERANNIELSRKSYCKSVVSSMPNLRWKVWLAGSRTELNQNNIPTARILLNRALEEVPIKTRAVVLIECARLEEYTGDLKKARQFLRRAQREAKHEWKVFLESILLEMRAGEHERAIEEAKKALKIHRGTGRLWAVLIQLKGCLEGPDAQLKVFREALDEVPKSGEVWCEGARIRLNPLTSKFNLEKARKYLDFAIKFTPQYGDSFIEYLRLELLTKGPYEDIPIINQTLYLPQSSNHNGSSSSFNGSSSSTSFNGTSSTTTTYQQQQIDIQQADSRPFDNTHYDIEQLCVNADPNYGPLWFHCKENVLDSTRQVLRRAKKLLMAELLEYRDLYQQAIMSHNSPLSNSSTVIVNNKTYSCRDFITGLHELNMTYSNASVSDMALRKKYIYGSEICV